MNGQVDEQTNWMGASRGQLNFIFWVVTVWSTSLEVFLHKDFGSRYLGPNTLGAFLLIPFFLIFWEGYDAWPLLCLWFAYIFMCAVSRWSVLWRRPMRSHTFYSGWPRLLLKKYARYEVKFKQLHEPFLVALVAMFATGFNPPLGFFLFGGAASLWIKVLVTEFAMEQRSLDLGDSIIEQQQLVQRFRHHNNDAIHY
jgi:hypothetical protein